LAGWSVHDDSSFLSFARLSSRWSGGKRSGNLSTCIWLEINSIRQGRALFVGSGARLIKAMAYHILDTQHGRKYTYKTELEARAVLKLPGMRLMQPRGWDFDPEEPELCEPPLEERRGGCLTWLLLIGLALGCWLLIGVSAAALTSYFSR
jgi:hypothetical protein